MGFAFGDIRARVRLLTGTPTGAYTLPRGVESERVTGVHPLAIELGMVL